MHVFLDAQQACTITQPESAHKIGQHMANRLVVLMDRVKELRADDGQLLLRTTVEEMCHGVCRRSCLAMGHPHAAASILSLCASRVCHSPRINALSQNWREQDSRKDIPSDGRGVTTLGCLHSTDHLIASQDGETPINMGMMC